MDATRGVTGIVEGMHHNISLAPGLLGRPERGRAGGVAGLVYRSVRGVTRLVGVGVDGLLAPFAALLGEQQPSGERDAVVAALNGVLGDHFVSSGNPLAISMRLLRDGRPLAPEEVGRGPLVIAVHGLGMSSRQMRRDGHDHAAALAADLDGGVAYLDYNSGLHISTNGRQLADLLEQLVTGGASPAALVILGFSMGGLELRLRF